MIEKIKEKIAWVRSPDFLAVLALFFLSLLFFYDLFGEGSLLMERDLGPYFIPPRFFWVESIKHGSFPLWNPYQFTGHPFFANPQHAILYPFNCLLLLLPFGAAFNAVIVLHFFFGGVFTYLFLRDLRVNPTGSLISGLIFMLSGYLLSVHSLLTILLSSVWTPLIMMFFRRAINGQGFKNEILTALLITISFLGGGIEIVYGNFFVLLIMVIFSDSPSPPFHPTTPTLVKGGEGGKIKGGWEGFRRIFVGMKSLVIVLIVFLFLSAVQLFPFVELFYHSIRGNGISYPEATTWSFAPKDILLFFLPDAYGYFLDPKKYWVTQCWFKTLYTGGLPFILSLIFFLTPYPQRNSVATPVCHCERSSQGGRARQSVYLQHLLRLLRSFHSLAMTLRHSLQRGGGMKERSPSLSGERDEVRGFGRDRNLYLALMIFSIFLSLGHYNPLYPFVFKYVPFFNGIRYPAKFFYLFILILSVTAGMGFQRLVEFSKESGNIRIKNLLTISSLICVLILLLLVLGHKEIEDFLRLREIDFPQFNPLSVNLRNTKRVFFYLTLFFLLIRVGDGVKWKSWVRIPLILFLITDLFGNMGYYGREKTGDYFRKSKSLESISLDKGYFRLFSTEKTISMDTTILVDDPTPFDILKEKNLPSMHLLYQQYDMWGIDVIRVKRTDDLYRVFVGSPSISTTHLIDLYGVKYITSISPLEADRKFDLIYANLEGLQGKREDLLKENTIKLYRNRSPLPRAWFVEDFKVMDSQTILRMMTQKEFQPGREVLLEEEPKWINPPTRPFVKGGERGIPKAGSGDLKEPLSGSQKKGDRRGLRRTNDEGKAPGRQPKKAEIVSETNNRLVLQATAEGNSLLVLSDTYYPGWKAFVDGIPQKIYRANYTFRALPVSAGTHCVEFVYDPLSFRLGAGATFLGIMGCVAIVLVSRRKRKWEEFPEP